MIVSLILVGFISGSFSVSQPVKSNMSGDGEPLMVYNFNSLSCEEKLVLVCGLTNQIYFIVKDILSVPCSKITAMCWEIKLLCSPPVIPNGVLSCEEKMIEICKINIGILELADACHGDIRSLSEQIVNICDNY